MYHLSNQIYDSKVPYSCCRAFHNRPLDFLPEFSNNIPGTKRPLPQVRCEGFYIRRLQSIKHRCSVITKMNKKELSECISTSYHDHYGTVCYGIQCWSNLNCKEVRYLHIFYLFKDLNTKHVLYFNIFTIIYIYLSCS